MPRWNDFLTERDKQVYQKSGWGQRMGFGSRPVLVIIDVSTSFCGGRRQPILEAIDEWHNACGEAAWDAVDCIAGLLSAARASDIPVIYATSPSAPAGGGSGLGRWADKNPREAEDLSPDAAQIVDAIAPRDNDVVLVRSKPSVFFGTELASYLVDLGADTVITCGCTTSGCVRATVTDGFSLNYRMIVVEEATFDRGEASHWINLFDMDQKSADVVTATEVERYLESLSRVNARA